MPTPFYKIFRNTLTAFRGKNIAWHLLAITLTVVLVMLGFDWRYYLATRNSTLQTILFTVGPVGFFVPIITPIVLVIFGLTRKIKKTIITGWALAQSALIGLLVSFLYKSVTGRLAPPFVPNSADISQVFQFSFFQSGVFWGWPSSHTTVAFATAVTLITLYPKNKPLRYLALLYAFYIGIGASATFHWFSDFVAGAIIGTVIGVVIGGSFLSVMNNQNSQAK
jgi:membrane-associated phospholipid phosphatase